MDLGYTFWSVEFRGWGLAIKEGIWDLRSKGLVRSCVKQFTGWWGQDDSVECNI